MKKYRISNIFIFVLSLAMLSCSKKIPLVKSYENFHQNPYGSYIEVKIHGLQDKLNIKGELIFADNKKIIIRTFEKPNLVRPFALKDVLSYQLYYAKNTKESYEGWQILNTLSTLSHGFFLILTLPINAIISGSVNTSKDAEFRYSMKDLPIEQLYKFARYPHSLPPGISLSNLDDIL
jgi:hypothetical protein